MLTAALVQEVDRLLRDGELSQRQIAARLGISRGTISAIANGHRNLHGRETRTAISPITPTAPPTRCPHCGYRVYIPCKICRTRAHRLHHHLLQILAAEHLKTAAHPNRAAPRVYFRAS